MLAYNAGVVTVSGLRIKKEGKGMDNTIRITGKMREAVKLPMCGKDSQGNLYEVDNLSLMKNGRRFLPVMGEFHFSRYEPEDWEEELLKMKAGGITVTATYVFWIHHEERRGEWDFGGCRDLRGFLETCRKVGMQVWLRIGPWAHGECRNGGFPDWLTEEFGSRLRSNDPGYLKEVRRLYQKIGEQAAGEMAKDGGPIIGIQLENEYGHCGGGPSSQEECMEHMRTLKRMALEAGMEVPYYTSTGWGGGIVVDGETLPVLGGYVDAPWAEHVQEMPASANFLFSSYKQDENIGSDLKRQESRQFTFDISRNPYLTAELGGGLQPTSHRRTYPWPEDIEAQALCMLGGGANLLGYYMYHGGINPEGKETTLQESRATGYNNDLPVKSYDFQTCIRESGEVNESYGRLRRLHLLLQDFGEELAGSEAVGKAAGYCEYEVCIGAVPVDKLHQLYLEADYVGDRAELYLDGRLADDWFTNGETWHAALKRFDYPASLVLRIYSSDSPIPNPYDNQVYYDLPVEKGCALRGVKAVAEYKTEL